MAVDLFSENSSISPRISFSRDFCNSDTIPIEQRPLRSPSSKPSSHNSSVDFDFCIPGRVATGESFDQASWSADEIFCDGKILPTEIKKRPEPRLKPAKPDPGRPRNRDTQPGRPETRSSRPGRAAKSEKQGQLVVTGDNDDGDVSIPAEEKHSTRSFWGFKRSSSLNTGSGYGRSLCPIALLSRSNSTGSTSTSVNGVNKQKQSARKQAENAKFLFSAASSSSSSSSSGSHNGSQKPPLKKSYGGYSYSYNGGVGGSGIRVNPVLNVVPSGNLFGLGSIFTGSGRDKNRKR
ncbi:PREDICTED: uncharacterized protein LOC104823858 [Tarenaya hassleriana]|uniref:uncharacterized protein LOC104823858 n=1 Tax=Tarenaya hassleriana TaxID=28532 RepID=UPI00053C4DDB|nr:PREDICTED: uncharacterized protein LOC104823858 [Tarenaya hassleriana]